MTRYALNPATPVLSRPDGTVQVGWDPRRAVVVHPPPGLSAAAVADLLRALQGAATVPDLLAHEATLRWRHGQRKARLPTLECCIFQGTQGSAG